MSKSRGFIDVNLTKLKELEVRQPDATHVYMRREDGKVVDIPIKFHAISTILQHPEWEIVATNETMDEEIAAMFDEPHE